MITISPFTGDGKTFEQTIDSMLDDHAESVGLPFNARTSTCRRPTRAEN
ncbi:MAG: hypothetical protein H6891_07020 [Brucellaceae bacterium]|nr:hypothetical protein [Brucellaceae bacterium]